MSFLAGLGSALGHLIGVDDSGVRGARNDLNASLNSGDLQNAAYYGQTGAALENQANALQKQNANVDWSKVDADQTGLNAITQHYLSQYANGGLQGQAAIQAAQSDRGLNAHGGMGGIRADTLNSQGSQGQVAQTAQGEINQAGQAVNQLDQQRAAMALQKAVLAAQVSHANLQNHLAANQTDFGLRNSQANLNNQVQAALNSIQNARTSTDIDFSNQQAQLGAQLLTGLLSAGAGGAGTAIQALQSGAGNTGQNFGTAAPLTSAVNIQPANVGAGYIQPAATVGRSASVNAPYSPIFSTPPTMPNTASFFNRGGA